MKKYRIKVSTEGSLDPVFSVQVRKWFGWVTIRHFFDPWDSDFAMMQAEELLDKLNEK